jgi:uncharacterized repeat protein (TIGR03837 family)
MHPTSVSDAVRLRAPRWDLFCRVVDHLGDAAIGWRLARQLAREHGLRPRLWIDRPEVLGELVPGAVPGIEIDGVAIERWDDDDPRLATPAPESVADVVVALLAGTPPDGYRAAMRVRRPVWVAYEYLSAEPWVASCHGLPSPKADGLVEHFFFPGFEPGTGGLLRECDLPDRIEAFDTDPAARHAFLASIGVASEPHTRFAALLCYPDSPVAALLDAFAARPERWRALLPPALHRTGRYHPVALEVPFVPQHDYDRLLGCCDLVFVRGEDSFVRALWSGRPMVWQIYRQAELAHRPKLQAFLAHWIRVAAPPEAAAAALKALHAAWNGTEPASDTPPLDTALHAVLDSLGALRDAAGRWRRLQAEHPDAASSLVAFIERRL